ncbi:hypothetical protein Ancab_030016 [Ancistrocladus abbreviatus]
MVLKFALISCLERETKNFALGLVSPTLQPPFSQPPTSLCNLSNLVSFLEGEESGFRSSTFRLFLKQLLLQPLPTPPFTLDSFRIAAVRVLKLHGMMSAATAVTLNSLFFF